MKKIVNVGIGGRAFILDEDAYQKLDTYLLQFRKRAGSGKEQRDIMEDLEQRIAELFYEELASKGEVVGIQIVNRVIAQLGMPDGSAPEESYYHNFESTQSTHATQRKLYRDPDYRVIGGVASGLSYYLNVDVVLIRIIFVTLLFIGTVGFWSYIIFWIVAPAAMTPSQKCEMRGIPVTAENMRKFSSYNK